MITIEDCTVRYWIGVSNNKYSEDYVEQILREYDLSKHILPTKFVVQDGNRIWLYCTFPIREEFYNCFSDYTPFLSYEEI